MSSLIHFPFSLSLRGIIRSAGSASPSSTKNHLLWSIKTSTQRSCCEASRLVLVQHSCVCMEHCQSAGIRIYGHQVLGISAKPVRAQRQADGITPHHRTCFVRRSKPPKMCTLLTWRPAGVHPRRQLHRHRLDAALVCGALPHRSAHACGGAPPAGSPARRWFWRYMSNAAWCRGLESPPTPVLSAFQ